MQLTQLRHLVGLAKEGSFSSAARALHITQPALSRSIRALETELGAALIDRVGHRSELTPFGRDVLERARLVLDGAQDIGDLGARQRAGTAGRLRVGLGSGPSALLTAPLLADFAQRTMRLEIARGVTDMLLQRLRERSLDALVIDVLSVPPASDLRIEMEVAMRGAFMCRPEHPLAAHEAVRFDQLRAYPIACTRLSDDIARRLIRRYGPAANPEELIALRGEDIPSLVDVTLHSDVILLAVRAVAPVLHELPVAPSPELNARFGLVTLARRSAAPSLPLLRERIQRCLHD